MFAALAIMAMNAGVAFELISCAEPVAATRSIGSASHALNEPPVANDCSSDVTAALNTWFAGESDGATIDLAQDGCYLVNGTVYLADRHNITIEGHNATIKATTDLDVMGPDGGGGDRPCTQTDGGLAQVERARLWFDRGSGIVLRDFKLEGTNTSDCTTGDGCHTVCREWDHNLKLWGTDDVTIENVKFEHAWGDAINLEPGTLADGGAVMATDVVIRDSTFDTVGRMGIGCTGCDNVEVVDSTFTNIGLHVVDAEPESSNGTASNIHIARNRIGTLYGSILAAASAKGISGPFVIEDNTQTAMGTTCLPPILIGHETGGGVAAIGDVTIRNNHLHTHKQGLYVAGTSITEVTVTGNTVAYAPAGCGDSDGLHLENAASGSVRGNTFLNAAAVGSPVSSAVTLCGNRLTAPFDAFDEPSACTTLTVPTSIDDTCTNDVTDDLNAWIAGLEDGTPIELRMGSCYRSEGTLSFTGKHGISIDGNFAQISASTTGASRARMQFDLGGGFTLRRLDFNVPTSCSGPSCQFDNGVAIRGAEDVLIENVTLTGLRGEGVSAAPGGTWDGVGNGAVIPRDVKVTASTLSSIGRNAFFCGGCQNFTAQDNTVSGIGAFGALVSLATPTWPGDMTLTGNTFTSVFLSILGTSGTGARLGPFIVSDNVGTNASSCYAPVVIGGSTLPVASVSVTDNSFFTYGDGIVVAGSSVPSAGITGNTIHFQSAGCGTATGVTLTNVTDGEIAGNTLVNASSLTSLSSSSGVAVCGNRTSANGSFSLPSTCP